MPNTGIEITAKPLGFPLNMRLMYRPVVEIDGVQHEIARGTQFLPAAAGYHAVSAWQKSVILDPFRVRGMQASAQVYVGEGQTARISYSIPLPGLVGKMTV